jgi:hypothetical protein
MAATKSAAMVLFGMIVRERRRVASLARTASSLDEKVQEAEAAAAAKDSAFRAYVDEQRHEVAVLTQNQQEQILSLMDMVRDETAGPSLSPKLNCGPLVGASLTPVEGHANPKLLVLANERISVLERQLRDLRLGYDAVAQHKECEEEARELLKAKTKECENLEQEIICLQEALRGIREATSRHEGDSQTAHELGRMFESSGEVLHIVANALHPEENSPLGKAKRHRLHEKSRHITPRRLAQGELTNSSDSEGVPDWAEDIMSDLAIIAEGKMPSSLRDIATPEDIEDRGGKSVFDRLTNPTAFTGVQKQKQTRANAQKKFRSSSTPPRSGQRQRKLISKQVADSLDMVVVPVVQDSYPKATPQRKVSQDRQYRGDIDETARRSVFDRLLSPSNLTGTQKQKYHDKRSKGTSDEGAGEEKKAQDEKNGQNDSLRSIQHSNSSLANVADDLLDELLSGNDDSENNIAESSRPGKKRLEYNNQNVFERLQKTTTQACAVKQHPITVEKTIGEKHHSGIAEKTIVELIDVGDSYKEAHQKIETSERVEEYMHLDVFERLQKTTTQAYAEKQNKNIAEKMLGDILDSDDVIQEDTKHGPVSSGFERVDGYVQQNVFERLTKTITHSYAVKQNMSVFDKNLDCILDSGKDQGKKMVPNSEHGSPGRGPMAAGSPPRVKVIGPPLEPKPSYVHQNVFERLQTTTTEAYAKKMNPPLEYHPQSSSGAINEGTGFHQSSMSSLPRNLDD